MKKIYIKPQAKAIALDASEVITESNLTYGGSNRMSGPRSAETKGSSSWDDEDEEW